MAQEVDFKATKSPEPKLLMKPAPETGAAGNIVGSIAHPVATGSQKLKVYPNGVVSIDRILFSLTKRMGGRIVNAAWDLEGVVFASANGEVIAEYDWPTAGTSYVGMRKARTRFNGEEKPQ